MAEPLLEARGIVKSFGRVRALRGASFTVNPGEVVALIGDNGAGKSTLVKTLSGVIHPDEGEIRFEGRPVSIPTPVAARELGIETVVQDPTAAVATMSGGQRQGVAVARAVTWAGKVVFMDEPTAALGVVQTRNVLDLIRRVRETGLAVVLISHNMPDVLAVSDRVEVLRLGERVAQFTTADTTMERLVGAMTGAIEQREPSSEAASAAMTSGQREAGSAE